MKKFLIICAAAATLGSAALVSTEASAHHRHHGWGWGGGYGGGWGGGYGGGYDDCDWRRVPTYHGWRWRCV